MGYALEQMRKLRAFTAVLAVAMLSLWGCASSTPPARPSARPFDDVRRLVIVVSGESTFTMVEHAVEPGRTFDEVIKWVPYSVVWRPVAQLVHRGINWALETDRAARTAPSLVGVSPRLVVAEAMARTLRASGSFDEVRILEQEPAGEERRSADAIVRVSVPAWGLVRVQEGKQDLLSGFADVRSQMAVPATGVVLWEDSQDVTHPERVPLESFMRSRDFARQEMVDVLERAGQRVANELLYARSAGK